MTISGLAEPFKTMNRLDPSLPDRDAFWRPIYSESINDREVKFWPNFHSSRQFVLLKKLASICAILVWSNALYWYVYNIHDVVWRHIGDPCVIYNNYTWLFVALTPETHTMNSKIFIYSCTHTCIYSTMYTVRVTMRYTHVIQLLILTVANRSL